MIDQKHNEFPLRHGSTNGYTHDEGSGYRYENMPEDRQAYRMGLQGFDETAHHLFGTAFIDLQQAHQEEVLRQVAEGSPPGETWERLSAVLFFQLFMSDVITNYYAHPSAWAEIGFNGPASPRGHIRLRLNLHDPWEAREHQPRSSVEIVRRSRGKRKGAGERRSNALMAKFHRW